ncbi:MAG TPA: exosome complex RNA-binding protein Rrp4 [candidate division Zixibacteria bacterium]|nr:exosome complex RNA-binding protein Rrp4 [candidate division Zixibacteria bacterium]
MTILIQDRSMVTPGEVIAEGDFTIGSHVYRKDKKIVSQVIGLVTIKDNQVSVVPLKGKYLPRVGDLVIGKIIDVSLSAWIVDIASPYPGIMRTSVSLDRRFDPVKDQTRKLFDVGDVIVAKVFSFDRTRDPTLTLRQENRSGGSSPYLGKLVGGRVIEVSPSKIPRLIGRRGSMISTIKQYTNSRMIVGQNGRVWFKGNSFEDEYLVLQAVEKIDREAHTTGLTDRIKEFLEEAKKNQKPIEEIKKGSDKKGDSK